MPCSASPSPPHLKVQPDGVDGVLGAPGVILESSGEESLREEEAADPVDGRNAVGDPALHEVNPLKQVRHPGGQRLQGRVGLGVRGGGGRRGGFILRKHNSSTQGQKTMGGVCGAVYAPDMARRVAAASHSPCLSTCQARRC